MAEGNISAVSPEKLQSYLLCLHNNTRTDLSRIATNINKEHLLVIYSKLESLNVTLLNHLREPSASVTKSRLTPEEIVPHYFWLIGTLIAIGAVQLVFSLACFALVLRLNLIKSKKHVQRKGSTNTVCSRLDEAGPSSSSAQTNRRPKRIPDRESRRLSTRITRRFNHIRNNSTLIAFLSTPPNYRAPAPPPPPENSWYENVQHQHTKIHTTKY